VKILNTLAVLAAFAPNGAFAQDANPETARDDNSEIVLVEPRPPHDIVVTATGVWSLTDQSGQAIFVLDKNEIEGIQSQSVADVLAFTPGVTVSRNGGAGQPTAVRIRGAEADQTLTLIDGVRVNDVSSPGGGFDFGTLLTGSIERIEILRGPNAVPWGSQALGGIVNIVTNGAPASFGGSLRAEYGGEDNKQLVGTVGGTFAGIKASVGGGYFSEEGISAFSGGSEPDGFRQYAANGRIEVPLSSDLSFDFRAYYANGRSNYDGFQAVFPYAQTDTAEYSKTEQFFGYAGVSLSLFDHGLKNHFAFTLSDTNRDNFDPAFGSAPLFFGRGRTERFEYKGDAQIGSAARIVFGAEHENSRFNDGYIFASTHVSSGYAQILVTPFKALTVTGGVRVDDHKSYGTKTSVSANAAWLAGPNTVIRASFGQGFKAPTLYQLYSDYGNTGLRPETANSYDMGISQSLLGGRINLGATLFLRNTKNQIDFASCYGSAAPLCATRPYGYYENVDQTRAKGLEAMIEFHPTDTLTAGITYSLIDAKNRASGARLIRRPVHSLSAGLGWKSARGVSLNAHVQLVSDSLDGFGGSVALDGYVLTSLRAAVPLGDQFELYGRIENVFDVRYETVSGYGTYGRNAHVGVRFKF
jgi:vitamin B12 transporter